MRGERKTEKKEGRKEGGERKERRNEDKDEIICLFVHHSVFFPNKVYESEFNMSRHFF